MNVQKRALNKRGYKPLISLGLAAACLSLPFGSAWAQQSEEDEDGIVTLSPFEVQSSGDVGYAAANTLSGSRMNTPLFKTSAPVSVLTQEFLDDLAVNDIAEVYEYALNTDARLQTEQSLNFRPEIFSDNSVQIRGLDAATARNYFVWSVNSDAYNIARLDVSRGPNNILFGVGGFGGVVNTGTKRALIGDPGSVDVRAQLRVGDWDLYRSTVDVNYTLNSSFAVRFNGVYHDEGHWKKYGSYERQGGHLAMLWNILEGEGSRTVLRADAEALNIDRVIARQFNLMEQYQGWNGVGVGANGNTTGVEGVTLPDRVGNQQYGINQSDGTIPLLDGQYITNFRFTNHSAPLGLAPPEQNMIGPGEYNNSDVYNYTLVLEQQLIDNLFLELAYNYQEDEHRYRDITMYNLNRDPNLFLANGSANPRFGEYFTRGGVEDRGNDFSVDELRATASYRWASDNKLLGNHQFALLYSDRTEESIGRGGDFINLNAPGAGREIHLVRYLSAGDGPDNTGIYPEQWIQQAASQGLTFGFVEDRLDASQERLETAQFVHVGDWLGGRVTTTWGVRDDTLEERGGRSVESYETGDLVWPIRERFTSGYEEWSELGSDTTWTYGITAGLSPDSGFRFYYNFSEVFVNQPGRLFQDINLGQPGDEGNIWIPMPPRVGETEDFGVRFQLFESRLNGSLGVFETQDIGAREFLFGWAPQFTRNWLQRDLLGLPLSQGWQDTSDRVSEGFELEIVANPLPNWRLMFNLSRTRITTANSGGNSRRVLIDEYGDDWNAYWMGWRAGPGETLPEGVTDNTAPAVNFPPLGRPLTFREAHGDRIDPFYALNTFGERPQHAGRLGMQDWVTRLNYAYDVENQDGQQPIRHNEYRMNFFTVYEFEKDSMLKGWGVGGGARFFSKPLIDQTFSPAGDLIYTFGEDYYEVDAFVSYETEIWNETSVKFTLNVDNVFDDNRVVVVGVPGAPQERGHLSFRDPRRFTLTAAFDF